MKRSTTITVLALLTFVAKGQRITMLEKLRMYAETFEIRTPPPVIVDSGGHLIIYFNINLDADTKASRDMTLEIAENKGRAIEDCILPTEQARYFMVYFNFHIHNDSILRPYFFHYPLQPQSIKSRADIFFNSISHRSNKICERKKNIKFNVSLQYYIKPSNLFHHANKLAPCIRYFILGNKADKYSGLYLEVEELTKALLFSYDLNFPEFRRPYN